MKKPPGGRLLRSGWQCHEELRTLSRSRDDANTPAVELNDLLAERKAKTGTAFLGTNLHKRLEYPALLGIGDPFTVVLYSHEQAIVLAHGLKRDATARRRMAKGIADEVVQHPAHLCRVQRDAGKRGMQQFHHQLDRLVPSGIGMPCAGLIEQLADFTRDFLRTLQAALVA